MYLSQLPLFKATDDDFEPISIFQEIFGFSLVINFHVCVFFVFEHLALRSSVP